MSLCRIWPRDTLDGMPEHYRDVGHVGGRWGHAGSGLLFTTGRRILLLLRADWVMEPGTWGIPGGAIPVDEHGRAMDPFESALREAREEIGPLPPYCIVDEFVFRESGFRYTTYTAQVERQFTPVLNEEHDDFMWWNPERDSPLELHPGVEALLRPH
jgi:8-oxo-dGTP pyrophosphatase MutT (NUDIX family)